MSATSRDDPGFVPIPDPTLLTTQQLLRELASLKELLQTKLDVAEKGMEILEQTMTGHFLIDQERFSKIEERFRLVEERRVEQFSLIEERRREQKKDTQVTLDAAFAAQKETLDNLGNLSRTTSEALSSKLDDVKERVGRMEAADVGATQYRERGLQGANLWVAIAAVVAALVVGYFLIHHTSAPVIIQTPSGTTTTSPP